MNENTTCADPADTALDPPFHSEQPKPILRLAGEVVPCSRGSARPGRMLGWASMALAVTAWFSLFTLVCKFGWPFYYPRGPALLLLGLVLIGAPGSFGLGLVGWAMAQRWGHYGVPAIVGTGVGGILLCLGLCMLGC